MKYPRDSIRGLIVTTILFVASTSIADAATVTSDQSNAASPLTSTVKIRDELAISLIKTAESAGAPEAILVANGDFFTERRPIHVSILIEHPYGTLLYDTGLGRNIDDAFNQNSWFQRQLFAYENVHPAVDQLADRGIQPNDIDLIIPSHLHWDHVGGLPDFPNVPVWVTQQGLNEALNHGHRPAYLPELTLQTQHWKFVHFNNADIHGFQKSFDVFNDGKIILVDLAGHTPGQIGLFVTLDSGKQYFFIGDTSWTDKGVRDNVARPGFLDWISPVDWNAEQNNQLLAKIHQLQKNKPNIIIMPAHDEGVLARISTFPARTL